MRLLQGVFLFVLGARGVLGAQDATNISSGTVNIALSNANGLILLTDSVQTVTKQGGPHFTQPVPKLFRLDDKTVCSIAGFASETGWIPPELNTNVAGIIDDFRDQLSQRPVRQFDAKLRALAFMVGFYIDLIANRYEVLVGDRKPDTYKFELILAGYDADGATRLEKMVILSHVITGASGKKYWSHTSEPIIKQVGKKLVPLFGGIPNFSQAVWDNPQEFVQSDIVRKYMKAKKRDGGSSLTRDEMVALASYMASVAAKHTQGVGGPDQVAVLADGKIMSFNQPQMPDPPRPLHFSVVSNVKIQGALMFYGGPDNHLVFIRTQFVGIRNPRLRLDGQFFYGCEIRESIVEYAGSLTDFGPTNTVVNSMILPSGNPVGPASTNDLLKVLNGFNWSLDPPSGPPLQPMVSPLPD
jgi:20S proteasome alpha/beta subunit